MKTRVKRHKEFPLRNIFLAGFFACAVLELYGEPRWFISNAAGMTLESAYTRLALRSKYALMIDSQPSSAIPDRLRQFYDPSYSVEIRVLYENGEESRRQWLFVGEDERIRLVAVFNAGPLPEDATAASVEAEEPYPEKPDEAGETEKADEEDEEKPDLSGFIEIYNTEERISEEHQIDSNGEARIITYFYVNQTLVRAETAIKKPASEEDEPEPEAYCTDYYRYSRSASLRAVERVYHRSEEAGDNRARLPFPHMVLDAARQTNFVRPVLPISSDFFQDILKDEGDRVIYNTDARGRILTETHKNEAGEIVGELQNTWTGNRLTQVRWTSGEDERITEYEYNDDGDRILEKNINKETLERVIRISGDQEIEELYMDDRVVLRAVWKNGRKISEKRVREEIQ
ncbi:MAG: hypothetical protein LBU18_01230 [Treponema sp.]|jgi:hypothetical protein|nr:hypothetical protein [Treponema sp.]